MQRRTRGHERHRLSEQGNRRLRRRETREDRAQVRNLRADETCFQGARRCRLERLAATQATKGGRAMNKFQVRVMRLPHSQNLAADIPLPAYQSAHAAGLDLHASIPAGSPIVIAPGGARGDSNRPCICAPRWGRGSDPAALRAGAALRRHGAQFPRHDRRRLSRRGARHSRQSWQRAIHRGARGAHRSTGFRADRASRHPRSPRA
jgi:hypothetical protein